jgi:hypothetical protein
MPVRAQSFNSFEEALQSIHADPADFSADPADFSASDRLASASDRLATSNVDETANPPSARQPTQHCVVQIEPLTPGKVASAMSEASCFDSFSDAQAIVPLSHTTVISIDYRDSNFSGSTLTWVVDSSYGGCTTGYSYAAPSMPSGWNDVVSSARTYAGCSYNRHYEHTNYGGSKIDCYCATMGAMNDKTSSEKWNRVQPSP